MRHQRGRSRKLRPAGSRPTQLRERVTFVAPDYHMVAMPRKASRREIEAPVAAFQAALPTLWKPPLRQSDFTFPAKLRTFVAEQPAVSGQRS
jgi:hypothetical protein